MPNGIEDRLLLAGAFLNEASKTHKYLLDHRSQMTLEDRREYIQRCIVQVIQVGLKLMEQYETLSYGHRGGEGEFRE